MNWESYVDRRKIDVSSWLGSRGVTSQEDFLKVLENLKLEPPNDDYMRSLFPQAQPETKNESASVAAEGSDQVTARSVAPEGDGTDLRPDGKRTAKVRSH